MDVSDAVETGWTARRMMSAFVAIALASFCSPTLQTLHSSKTPVQHHQEQFDHKGKIEFCVLAKTSAKVSIRKGSAQQSVQLFYSASDVSLQGLSLSARSICATAIHSEIARGSVAYRERAPPL
jgi:L-asparaginase/Glu-tRNA(Gln) amidotransferase subunit D